MPLNPLFHAHSRAEYVEAELQIHHHRGPSPLEQRTVIPVLPTLAPLSGPATATPSGGPLNPSAPSPPRPPVPSVPFGKFRGSSSGPTEPSKLENLCHQKVENGPKTVKNGHRNVKNGPESVKIPPEKVREFTRSYRSYDTFSQHPVYASRTYPYILYPSAATRSPHDPSLPRSPQKTTYRKFRKHRNGRRTRRGPPIPARGLGCPFRAGSWGWGDPG
jgi:hypothetical protein